MKRAGPDFLAWMARDGGLDSAIGDDSMSGSIFHFAAERFQFPFQLGRPHILLVYKTANLIK
jgi:hypothetical protein